MVIFFAPQVRDAASGQLLAGLVGQTVTIVYPGTSNPVEITEYPSGATVPGSTLTVGSEFSVTSFDTPDGVHAVEAVAANGTRAYLESAMGSRVAAESARDAAEVAVASAASLASGVVRSVNGTTPDGAGNVDIGPGGEPTVTAHGALSGLGNDDHPQYLNQARGDARYYTKTQSDNNTSSAVASAIATSSPEDRKRANHSGTQEISTIVGLSAALADYEDRIEDLETNGTGGGGNPDAIVYRAWTGTAWPPRPDVNYVNWVGGSSALEPPAEPGDLWTRPAELE